MRAWVQRHAILAYYILVFSISWGGILVVAGCVGIPSTGEEVARLMPLALIPLFAGPSVSGVVMNGVVGGTAGLRDLGRRLLQWQGGARRYAGALLTGPIVVAAGLGGLSLLSSAYIPSIITADNKLTLLLFGLGWGLAGGGFLEELGWTGFATPRLRLRHGAVATGLIVGLLWGAWHLLVALWGSRGMAGEGSLALFIASFVAFYFGALPAYRILMVWIFDGSGSLPLTMLMHAVLSASTLILQPTSAGAPYLIWNLVLAGSLWVIVAATAFARRLSAAGAIRPRYAL